MEKQEFYQHCADILGIEHQWTNPPTVRARWTNRFTPSGNGRFAGLGLIRWFGPNLIHVSLKNPAVNRSFDRPEDVLEFLRQMNNRSD